MLNADSLKIYGKAASKVVSGQGLSQLVQAVIGILLIRWLSIEHYAQYSVAFAFQSVATMLVEFGFSGSIIALVGGNIHDKELIGRYIRAGQFYRVRAFLIVGVITLIIFPFMMAGKGWSWSVIILLLSSILINLYYSGFVSYYSPVLQIHKKLGTFYIIQIVGQVIRLVLLSLTQFFFTLNAWLAAFSTSIYTIFIGVFYRKKSQPYVKLPQSSDPETKKEMVNYLLPIMPGILFAAFQGQISVFIIGVFGNIESLAQVAALGRLSQLFVILNALSGALVAPYIARQALEGLLKKYLFILGLGVFAALAIALLGFLFPTFILRILGSQYQGLEKELGLIILNASIIFINGLIWAMNASRKWVFYWMPILSITGTLGIQILGVVFFDLSTTYNVIMLSLITSLFMLLNRLLVGGYGFTSVKNLT